MMPSGFDPSTASILVPATRISVLPEAFSISKAYVPLSEVNPAMEMARSPPNVWTASGSAKLRGTLTPVGDGMLVVMARPSLLISSSRGPVRSTPASPTMPTVPPVVLMAYLGAFVPCFSTSMATPAPVTLTPNSPVAL